MWLDVRCPVSNHVLCRLEDPVAGPRVRLICRCKDDTGHGRVVIVSLNHGSFTAEIEAPRP